MISKEKRTWEITQPSIDRKVEDKETQFPCPGCKDEGTLELTLGVSSCAFQELRRRVVPFGRSRIERYREAIALSRGCTPIHPDTTETLVPGHTGSSQSSLPLLTSGPVRERFRVDEDAFGQGHTTASCIE